MKKIEMVSIFRFLGDWSFARLKVFAPLLCLLFLSACNDCKNECPRCVAADDFGLLRSSIAARFEENSPNFKSEKGDSADGKHADQVIRWKKTGYYTDGNPLYIRVNGKWLGIAINHSENKENTCSNLEVTGVPADQKCTYIDTSYNDPISGCNTSGKKINLDISYGGRCWIENGYGAYLLFKRPGDPDPNESLDVMRNPISPVMHLGHTGDFASSDINQIIDSQSCQAITKIEDGWEIYAKIYDIFYWDNAGGYQIDFLKGVVDTKEKGFFESIRSTVTNFLLDQTKSIYVNIISNNAYINFVKALLVLFVALTGITFLLGMSQNTGNELLIKVLKIAFIIQLISPSSWDFFYNNLFALFTQGLNQIIAIINSHMVTYDQDRPFYFLDQSIAKIFKIYGSTKTLAVLYTPFGLLWCMFMLIVMLIYVILVAYAFIIYLTAFVAISLLIILMPILFLGLLFGPLKHTFDNWFTQAISFCMQSIMIFTLVSLFSAMIMNNFYRTLGFTTCCNKTFVLDFSIFGEIPVYNWTMGQRFIPVRMGFVWDVKDKKRLNFDDNADVIKIPPDYDKTGCRFVDYPFLDPGIADANCKKGAVGTTRDWDRIQSMRSSDLNMIDFGELFGILLLAFMMYHMRDFVQSVGASIAGASPFQSVIGFAYASGMGVGQLYQELKNNAFQVYSNASFSPIGIRKAIKGLDLIPEKLKKTKGGKALGKIATGLSSAGKVLKFTAGAESALEREYFLKGAFKEVHYAQSVLGYHLGKFRMTGDFSDGAGVRFLKWGAHDTWNTLITRQKEEGFLHAIKREAESGKDYKEIMWAGVKQSFGGQRKLYKCEMEKIHDYILGVKHPKPQLAENRNDLPEGSLHPFKTEEQRTAEEQNADTQDQGNVFTSSEGSRPKDEVQRLNTRSESSVVYDYNPTSFHSTSDSGAHDSSLSEAHQEVESIQQDLQSQEQNEAPTLSTFTGAQDSQMQTNQQSDHTLSGATNKEVSGADSDKNSQPQEQQEEASSIFDKFGTDKDSSAESVFGTASKIAQKDKPKAYASGKKTKEDLTNQLSAKNDKLGRLQFKLQNIGADQEQEKSAIKQEIQSLESEIASLNTELNNS